jgi:hypothetical protein
VCCCFYLKENGVSSIKGHLEASWHISFFYISNSLQFLREKKNLKKIYTSQYLRTWWLVSTFFGPRYIGDDFFLRSEWVEISPLSKLGYRYTIFFQVKTTHFIRLTPGKLFIGCFFFFVQLNNYISNLSLLKYFIQKIYGKRDISQRQHDISAQKMSTLITKFEDTVKYIFFSNMFFFLSKIADC